MEPPMHEAAGEYQGEEPMMAPMAAEEPLGRSRGSTPSISGAGLEPFEGIADPGIPHPDQSTIPRVHRGPEDHHQMAKQRWEKAYRKAKFAKMFTDSAMSLIMKDRTGASLLDLETGDSLARKQVEDHYRSFKEHRDECERRGQYKEAKAAAAEMVAIREKETRRRRDELEKSHTADMIKVEALELREMQELSGRWRAAMDKFEEAATLRAAAMAERHKDEHARLHRRIFGPLESPKWSTHLLNLRKMQEAMAALNDYERAHDIQQKAHMLQAQEMRVLEVEAMSRHEVLVEKLNQKQEQDREHLQDRVEFGRRKRDVQQTRDFKNLETRYRNIKLEVGRIQEQERTQLQQAVDHSIGLGKNNVTTDIIDQEDVARPATAPMRRLQHAYDWNVRFGNKAGNASTITSALGLSAVEKGEQVLHRRRRSGRATLAVASATMPQPHHGAPMPFYLEPSSASHIKPLKPASGCHRIAASNPTAVLLFRKAASSSDAAIDIYTRPHTAPTGSLKPPRPQFGKAARPRTRGGRSPPSRGPREPAARRPGTSEASGLPRDSSEKGLSFGAEEPARGSKAWWKRGEAAAQPEEPVRQAWRSPNLTGLGSRPPGAGPSRNPSHRRALVQGVTLQGRVRG